MIVTHIVHICVLGWELETRTEAGVMLPKLQLRA